MINIYLNFIKMKNFIWFQIYFISKYKLLHLPKLKNILNPINNFYLYENINKIKYLNDFWFLPLLLLKIHPSIIDIRFDESVYNAPPWSDAKFNIKIFRLYITF